MPDTPNAPFWVRLFGGASADEAAALRGELERVSRHATELTERCAELNRMRERDAVALDDLRSAFATLSGQVEAERAGRERTDAALLDLETKAGAAAQAEDVASIRTRLSALAAEFDWERADRRQTIEALIDRIELHPGLASSRVRAGS
jgi:chromosome segregation ATPase